jgi:hypothetical protein
MGSQRYLATCRIQVNHAEPVKPKVLRHSKVVSSGSKTPMTEGVVGLEI